jgi:hypothetical protein
MQQFGIYYPYVHFVNESWVKTAALYWPRMARMIPPNFVSADSSTVRQLIDDLGFVVDVDPSPCASKVSAAMEAIVRSHSAELRRQFSVRSGTGTAYLRQALDVQSAPRLPQASPDAPRGIAHVGGSISRKLYPERGNYAVHPELDKLLTGRSMSVWTELQGSTRLLTSRLAGLHAHETSPTLRGILREEGLAVEGDADWIGVHPRLAWVHLCALASEVATRNRKHSGSLRRVTVGCGV